MLLAAANSHFRKNEFQEALRVYQKFADSHPELSRHVELNIEICRKRLASEEDADPNKKEGPLVTIIVPVFNVEKYLEQCLRSILDQTLKNIEVIVVDDGSTDGSSLIIDKYESFDKRIISIKNSRSSGNSGTPRNQALARARGQYIGFVDSDDWIEPNMLEVLYKTGISSGAEVVSSSGFFREMGDAVETVTVNHTTYDPDDGRSRKNLYLSPHFPIVWFRLYKAKLINSNHIRFGETRTSADLPFAFKALFATNKMASVPNIFYHYRFDRPGSTIDRRKGKGAFELFYAYKSVVDFLVKRNAYEQYISHVLLKAVGDYNYNLRFLAKELAPEFTARMAEFIAQHVASGCDLTIFNKYWAGVLEALIKKNEEYKLVEVPVHFQKVASPEVEHQELLSIIVPAYNVETHIDKCLASLSAQTLQNIEIIVVNDGSSDKTLDVIQSHMIRDSRIKLINCNVPSGSPGVPRNVALCGARGEFIGFVDADDWVEENMFELLYKEARNGQCDIVSASAFVRHVGEVSKRFEIMYRSFDSEQGSKYDSFKSGFFSNIWNRIYSNKLIKENDISFPSIYLSEDLCFSFVCHAFAKKTKEVNGCFYHYMYDRPNSTTFLRKGSKGFSIIESFGQMTDYFKSYEIYEKLATYVTYKKFNSLWYTFERLEEQYKAKFLREVKALYAGINKDYIDFSLYSDREIKNLNLLRA